MKWLLLAIFIVSASAANAQCVSGNCPYYTGIVATKGYQPNSFAANNFSTWLMSRTIHFARGNINNPSLVYGNFYVPDNTNQENAGGSGTIKTAIEYPLGGTPVLCGSGAVTFPAGLTVIACTAQIPTGAAFAVRTLVTNANGTPYTSETGFMKGEGFVNSTGTPQDSVLSGTITQTTNPLFPPVAIIGRTALPSICIHGDSRAYGSQETDTNNTGDVGDVARTLGASFGYTKMATNGALLSAYLTSHAIRDQVMAYCSHAIDEYGFNDKAAGQTDAAVAANRATFAALYPNVKVIGTTLYNSTNSTGGSWTTLVDQTVNANAPQGLNALIRAGIAGEVTFWDVDLGLDPNNTGKFPVNGSANLATPDGVHVNNGGSVIIRNSGTIVIQSVVR